MDSHKTTGNQTGRELYQNAKEECLDEHDDKL